MRQYFDFGITTSSFLKLEQSAFIRRTIEKLIVEVNKPVVMQSVDVSDSVWKALQLEKFDQPEPIYGQITELYGVRVHHKPELEDGSYVIHYSDGTSEVHPKKALTPQAPIANE